jgi:uridine kinase
MIKGCVSMQITSIDQLIHSINLLPRKQNTLLIGIDGCGGSGKSTFSGKLEERCRNVTIVHFDDFYLPSSEIIQDHPKNKPIGADFDYKRLFNQVLNPLSQNRVGKYQRYDWNLDQLAEWHQVPVGGIVIIEGVYSLREELVDMYDYSIWVECPRETRLARGLDRDGEEARDMWEKNWMIAEDLYMEAHRPYEKAKLIISGTK